MYLFNLIILFVLTYFMWITKAYANVDESHIFHNLHTAIIEVVKADDKKDVLLVYSEPFENVVSYLVKDLFKCNYTVTLFFIDSREQASNYIYEIELERRKVITINLLNGDDNSKWIQVVRTHPSLKRPNKHIFLTDVNDAKETSYDFLNWEDEVIATVFIVSMTLKTTPSTLSYFNLPCEDEDPVQCTINWTLGHYDPNYKIFTYEKLLESRTFTVAVVQEYFTKNESQLTGTEAIEFKLLQFLSSKIGFKYKIIKYLTNDWGSRLANGTWTGLLSLVTNGVADMTICEVIMTLARMHVVDFSYVYLFEPTAILSRAPSTEYNPFLIFRPLNLNVWIVVLSLVFWSGAAFKLMLLFADFSSTQSTHSDLASCFFHSYRVFFGHSVWEPSKVFSIRFFSVTLNSLGFFVIMMYGCRLISALSYRQQTLPVDSLYDLLRVVKNGEKLYFKNDSLLEGKFKIPDNGPAIYNQIYKAAELSNSLQFITSKSEFNNVYLTINDNGGVVASEVTQLRRFLAQPNVDSHKYHISTSEFATNLYGIAMKRGLRLRPEINAAIVKLARQGILSHWYKESMPDVKRRRNVALIDSAIEMYDLLGAWFIFAVGLPLTVVITRHDVLYICSDVFDCGRNEVQPEKRIFGGFVPEKHAIPWIVAIVKAESLKTIHCGGSLISENHVLSAAHCFKGLSTDKLVLYIGIQNLDDIVANKKSSYSIKTITIHDDYPQSRDHNNDLAIVEIMEPITFSSSVQPICLGNTGMDTPGIVATVAGFGHVNKLKLIGIANSNLRCAELPIKEPTVCEMYPRFEKSTMICAGHTGRGACQGDSGSPLMVRLEDQWFLIGVTASGASCHDKFSVTTYTKISIHLTWIIETLEKSYSYDDF